MAKAELKTRETDESVDAFIDSVDNEQRRSDARALVKIFEKITGEEPRMWGPAIIGFGRTMLKYASGRELEWPRVAFSPRKANMTLYLTLDITEFEVLLADLGPHTTGVCCLYIKRLSDVNAKVLQKLIRTAYRRSE
jgi:hypothetical protein